MYFVYLAHHVLNKWDHVELNGNDLFHTYLVFKIWDILHDSIQ